MLKQSMFFLVFGFCALSAASAELMNISPKLSTWKNGVMTLNQEVQFTGADGASSFESTVFAPAGLPTFSVRPDTRQCVIHFYSKTKKAIPARTQFSFYQTTGRDSKVIFKLLRVESLERDDDRILGAFDGVVKCDQYQQGSVLRESDFSEIVPSDLLTVSDVNELAHFYQRYGFAPYEYKAFMAAIEAVKHAAVQKKIAELSRLSLSELTEEKKRAQKKLEDFESESVLEVFRLEKKTGIYFVSTGILHRILISPRLNFGYPNFIRTTTGFRGNMIENFLNRFMDLAAVAESDTKELETFVLEYRQRDDFFLEEIINYLRNGLSETREADATVLAVDRILAKRSGKQLKK